MSDYLQISDNDKAYKICQKKKFVEHENLHILISFINNLIHAFLSHERCMVCFQGRILSAILVSI